MARHLENEAADRRNLDVTITDSRLPFPGNADRANDF
jgi:hypothetical protein